MNNQTEDLILSIIIPTKNRQYTALYAIASAVMLDDSNIEIIVQDCSDENTLASQIQERFGDDKRIKYAYTNEPISMTANWNLAIERTNGRYVCGIGDDDAVLPGILQVVYWMKNNHVDSTLPPKINYTWKDAQIGTFSNCRLRFAKNFDGNIYRIDIESEFLSKVKSCGFGYTDNLPNIYHAIIDKEILIKHKNASGNYLNGTSLDVYCAFAFAKYIKNLYYIDYPFTIRGACGKSNSNRIAKKNMNAHFEEIKSLKIPTYLPEMLTAEVSIAESLGVALEDTGRQDLIKCMNLAIVYGKSAALYPTKIYHLYKKYARSKNEGYANSVFYRHLIKCTIQRLKNSILQFSISSANKLSPRWFEFFLSKMSSSMIRVKVNEISDAIEFLNTHVKDNRITLGANREIRPMIFGKNIWD